MSNKSMGNRFEQELAQYLADAGFWVHVVQQNKAGQPADLIAAFGTYCTLIDCKVISDDNGFPLRRVEENQRYAMERFTDRTGNFCWFAMKLPDNSIHVVCSTFLFDLIDHDAKSLSDDFIRRNTFTLESWIDGVKRKGRRRNENHDW